MDFHFDPTVSKHTSLVVTTFQTAGTLLIALLLRLLTRGIPGRFLYYWSLGWVSLAAGAVSLTLSFLIAPLLPEHFEPWLRRPAIAAYAVFMCGFGFFLWAGCRAYARGIPLRPQDWWLFVVPALCGLIAPAFISNTDLLIPYHTAVVGGFGRARCSPPRSIARKIGSRPSGCGSLRSPWPGSRCFSGTTRWSWGGC